MAGFRTLGWNDPVREVLKHGTLSIGFIGLAETLVALRGAHHGENEASQNLGLEIVGFIRKFCDDISEQTRLNFTCLATPAEGLSGRFVRLDRERYGVLKGITDRDYYTNSFHVPVYFPIPAFAKISLEAPYHALTNAGHISYVEMDGDPLKNLDAFEKIIRHMHDAGIGYGSVNHPVDHDPVCGYNGVIDDKCPGCGRTEGDVPFETHPPHHRLPCGYAGPLQRRQAGRGTRPGQASGVAGAARIAAPRGYAFHGQTVDSCTVGGLFLLLLVYFSITTSFQGAL